LTNLFLEKDIKHFILKLPAKKINYELAGSENEGLVYVLENEKSWKKIFIRWLKGSHYQVKIASSLEEIKNLIENKNESPLFISLDVSLNTTDGQNVDGLSIIKDIKINHPSTKIFITTGYVDSISEYQLDVDYVFEKLNSHGENLTRDYFLSKIKSHL
jgi:CheY-like chemotaxis protein